MRLVSRTAATLACLALVGGLVTGCGGSKLTKKAAKAADRTSQTTSGSTSGSGSANPLDAGQFGAIAGQLEQELGYSPKVLEVTVNDTIVSFDVQDKAKPANVDNYVWRAGAFEGPTPVQLSGDGVLAENVFPLADLSPAAVDTIVAAGRAVKIEGATLSSMTAKRALPFSPDVQWIVSVSGTRESRTLTASPAGKILKTT